MIFVLGKTGSRKRKLFNLKKSNKTKLLPRIQKLYQITYIFCNTPWSVFVQSSDTNLLAARKTLWLQCICRAQSIIQTTHLNCRLPCNYVTSLLVYCRGQLRINRCTYCIKVLLRIFNYSVEIFKLTVKFRIKWY